MQIHITPLNTAITAKKAEKGEGNNKDKPSQDKNNRKIRKFIILNSVAITFSTFQETTHPIPYAQLVSFLLQEVPQF